MDKAEGALLVAERALEEVAALTEEVLRLRKAQEKMVSFAINDGGDLLVSSADGSMRSLGRVRGKDGRDAPILSDALIEPDGRLVLKMSDGATLKPGVVMGPPGKNGRDGVDGLGFEDFEPEWISDRELVLRWSRGDQVKQIVKRFPMPEYQETYDADREYEKGDLVTWGGSMWIARKSTSDKPSTSDAWKLCVKHGRDGRDRVSEK